MPKGTNMVTEKSGSQYSCHAKIHDFIASLPLLDSFSEHVPLVCSLGEGLGFLCFPFHSFHSNTRKERTKVKGHI